MNFKELLNSLNNNQNISWPWVWDTSPRHPRYGYTICIVPDLEFIPHGGSGPELQPITFCVGIENCTYQPLRCKTI